MPQSSYEFAAGRLAVLESKLLDQATIERFSDISGKAVVRQLQELGYGHCNASEQNSLETLIASELRWTKKLIEEISPEQSGIEILFLPNDAHNVKVLFKSRMGKLKVDENIFLFGIIDLDLLKKSIEHGYYGLLPGTLAIDFEKIEELLNTSPNGQKLCCEIDRTFFAFMQECAENAKSDFVKKYLGLQIDFVNMLSFARASLMKLSIEELRENLMPFGSIINEVFENNLQTSIESWAQNFNKGESATPIQRAIKKYIENPQLSMLENALQNELMDFVRSEKNQVFDVGPIFGFWQAKKTEAQALRLAAAQKQTGIKLAQPMLYR